MLSDGWLYASWVVGASRVRDVDPRWPSPGGVTFGRTTVTYHAGRA